MANRRLASKIQKDLASNDRKLLRAWQNGGSFYEKERLESELMKERLFIIKEAQKRGLKFIYVQIADGGAVYWETNRTTKMATFEWLYGGLDNYHSQLGDLIAVPIRQANILIKSFSANFV